MRRLLLCLLYLTISWSVASPPAQAGILDSLDVSRTDQGLSIQVNLNSAHQFASTFPQRDSDFFLIRLRPLPLAGNERNHTEHSRLTIPKAFKDVIEGISYESNDSEGTYLVLSLYRKAHIQVKETNSLQGLIIEVSFSPVPATDCESSPKTDSGKP